METESWFARMESYWKSESIRVTDRAISCLDRKPTLKWYFRELRVIKSMFYSPTGKVSTWCFQILLGKKSTLRMLLSKHGIKAGKRKGVDTIFACLDSMKLTLNTNAIWILQIHCVPYLLHYKPLSLQCYLHVFIFTEQPKRRKIRSNFLPRPPTTKCHYFKNWLLLSWTNPSNSPNYPDEQLPDKNKHLGGKGGNPHLPS